MRGLKKQELFAGYIFLFPWIVGFLLFLAGPMIGGIVLSFYRWNGISSFKYKGLSNYTKAFSDPDFWQSLDVTFTFVLTALPLRVIVALALALLVMRIKKFQDFTRTSLLRV
mgnify:CR=1 FL=1